MKTKKLIFFAPTFILTTLFFSGILATLSNKAYAQAQKIEVVKGKIERMVNGRWSIVKQGAVLAGHDLIRPSNGATAQVRCNNGTESYVPRTGGVIGKEVCPGISVESSNNRTRCIPIPNAPSPSRGTNIPCREDSGNLVPPATLEPRVGPRGGKY